MKKFVLLAVFVFGSWYLYQHFIECGVPSEISSQNVQEKIAGDSTKNGGGVSAGDAVQVANPQLVQPTGGRTISGCKMVDESGNTVDLDDILSRNKNKILVLHINNANREHCPKGDDKEHFNAIADLQSRYADRIEVVGYNFSGNPNQVRDFKSYYGVNYAMLTIPQNLASMDEFKRVKAFYGCIGATNGALKMPMTLFVKDGKYIVKNISGLIGYSELDNALQEALGRG